MVSAGQTYIKTANREEKSSSSLLLKMTEHHPGDDLVEEFFMSCYCEYSEHMVKVLSSPLLNSPLFSSNANGELPRLTLLYLLFQLYSGE